MNPEKRPLNWKDLSTSRKVQLGGITLLVALGGADVATTRNYPLTTVTVYDTLYL